MTKTTKAETEARNLKARDETRSKVLDILAPYHARSLSVVQGEKNTYVSTTEVFSIYSREADCGGNPAKGEPHDRYALRGLVLVQFFREGGAQFFFAEEVLWKAAGVDPAIGLGNTWERTAKTLGGLLG